MKNLKSVTLVIDRTATARRIRELRKKSGYTVSQLCEFLELTTDISYYKWARGQTLPTLEHLVRLAFLFRVSLDDIVVVRIRYKKAGERDSAPPPFFDGILGHGLDMG